MNTYLLIMPRLSNTDTSLKIKIYLIIVLEKHYRTFFVSDVIIGSPTISGINSFLFNKIILLLSPRLHCLRAVRSCTYTL
jgi:hypothetical protein